MKRWSILSCALICTYACDSRTVLRQPPNSNVTISPPSATVDLSTSKQFTATVKNSSNQSVTWSLTGSGCSGADCGSIDANGLYRAPDNYFVGVSVTVVAASVVDPSQTGTADVTLNSSVAVSVADQSIDIGGTRRFMATVNGTANKNVTWSISGPGCDDNACGWIDATTGVYTAPDEPPTPVTFTATATSAADASKSGNGAVTITTFSNANFVGHYAFVLSGFENSGRVIAVAGAFRAELGPDNRGRIREGVLEMDRSSSSPQLPVSITGGVYSYGADNRGRLRLDLLTGASLSFRCAMNNPGSAHAGRIILFQPDDPTHISGSGMIKKQATGVTSLSGDFAFAFSGDASSGRVGALGRLTLAGPMISGTMDVNLSGPTTSLSATGIYNESVTGNAYGRRGAMLSPSPPLPVVNLSLYIVSANEAFFVTRERADGDPLLSGDALKQSPTSLSGALVFYSTGLFSPGTSATIGRFSVLGSNFAGALDQNSNGVITSNMSLSGQITALDSTTGHGTLNFRVGGTGPLTEYAFQLVGPNRGFLMEINASEVAVGFMEAQTSTNFSRASFVGPYTLGTASPATCGCTSVTGVATLTGATGQFSGARDTSKAQGLSPRDSLTGTFDLSALGRGTLTTVTPEAENSVIYAVSGDKFISINVDPSVTLSVVTLFER